MKDLLGLVVHHGYIFMFLIVLAEALGLPVPAALALLTAGAAVASGALSGPAALLIAVTAMLLGDSLLYVLGSRMGRRLLGVLSGCPSIRKTASSVPRNRSTNAAGPLYWSPSSFPELIRWFHRWRGA